MSAAERAIGIFAQLEFTEAHGERVEQEQAANERLADADDELQRLGVLPEIVGSIQAAIARAVGITKDGYLAFEAENRAVDIGLAEEHGRVVYEIARREIVGAVHDEVVVFQNIESVFAGEMRFESVNLNIRIQIAQAIAGSGDFRAPYIFCAEENLTLQVGGIYCVEINEADAADSSRGKIQTERRAKAAGADA